MSFEFKKIFENIKKFRGLINEQTGDNAIVDAIENHKILYIYYDGDETILKGYRTIKPFVLGTHNKTGNKVLRAWQDAGSSDSYRGLNRKRRQGHEYHFDHKNRQKPGWRLFRLDGIKSVLPTGEQFNPQNVIKSGGVKYNPNDIDMSSISKAIDKDGLKKFSTTGLDSIEDPDVIGNKVDKSDFDKQAPKFKRFFDAGKKNREATEDEIRDLYDINKKIKKKSPSKMWVVQNEKGDMVLKSDKVIDKIPDEAIVGNLRQLYTKLITDKGQINNNFFDKEEKEL